MRAPLVYLLVSALAVSTASVSSRETLSNSINVLIKRTTTSPTDDGGNHGKAKPAKHISPGSGPGSTHAQGHPMVCYQNSYLEGPATNKPYLTQGGEESTPHAIQMAPESEQVLFGGDDAEAKFENLHRLFQSGKIESRAELGAYLATTVHMHGKSGDWVDYQRGRLADVHGIPNLFHEDDWDAIKDPAAHGTAIKFMEPPTLPGFKFVP
jgi:hypothetical protein